MFDTQDFQPTDAVEANTGCSTIASGAIDATVDEPLQFPCTLKQVAEKLGVSYNTLKNNWIQKIEGIYEGYQPVRNSRKFVTAFGFSAIENYVIQVFNGRMGFEEYAENERKIHNIIQAQYVENIDKAENDPGIDQIDHDELAQQTYTNPLDELMNWTPPATAKGEIVRSVKAELAPPQTTEEVEQNRLAKRTEHQELMANLNKMLEFAEKQTDLYIESLRNKDSETREHLEELRIREIQIAEKLRIAQEEEVKAQVRERELQKVETQTLGNLVNFQDRLNRRVGRSG